MGCIKVHVHTIAGLKGFVTLSASVDEAGNVNLCVSSSIRQAFAGPVARDASPLVFPLLNEKQDFLSQLLVLLAE